MQTNHADVDGIPVAWIEPDSEAAGAVLWLHSLGGSLEQSEPMLRRIAGRGRLAVTFDAPGHGRRGAGDPWEHAGHVLGSFRRRMWPLLGTTTLECLRVLDWIDRSFPGVPAVRAAGGLSMGGDIAVALAGIDPRISSVSAIVSTPDWTRPGMRTIGADTLLEQGTADTYAQWFYDAFDPVTHLPAYHRDVAIDFQCGQDDTHVPADGALRFRDALRGTNNKIQVDVHPGVSHVAGVEPLYDRALDWLAADDRGSTSRAVGGEPVG